MSVKVDRDLILRDNEKLYKLGIEYLGYERTFRPLWR